MVWVSFKDIYQKTWLEACTHLFKRQGLMGDGLFRRRGLVVGGLFKRRGL